MKGGLYFFLQFLYLDLQQYNNNLSDIVSLAHNNYFWGQKLNHKVSFWLQKLNHNVSFGVQKIIKWEKFLFEWIFLVSIELTDSPKPAQIIFSFMLARTEEMNI